MPMGTGKNKKTKQEKEISDEKKMFLFQKGSDGGLQLGKFHIFAVSRFCLKLVSYSSRLIIKTFKI